MKYNIDFGMPTLIEFNSLKDNIKLCSELGLNFIELNMNLPEFQANRIDVDALNEYRSEYDIYFTIHLDENLNICDYNDYVSEAYTKTVIDTIEIAKKINAPIINMHMHDGVYFTLPDKKVYLFEQYEDEYMNKIMSFADICEKHIGKDDILISIENTGGYKSYHKKAIDYFLRCKVFSLTYDVGHSFCADDVDLPFIEDRLSNLAHIHLHDAKEKNNHLALGDGNINYEQKIDLAEKCGCRAVIEVKTVEGLKKSVEILKH